MEDIQQIQADIIRLNDEIKLYLDALKHEEKNAPSQLDYLRKKAEELYAKSIEWQTLLKVNLRENKSEEVNNEKSINPVEPSLIGQSVIQHLSDSKMIIGINEKFRFINDLFHGNAQEYQVAVNQINAIDGELEISAYLDSLKRIYNWDEKNPLVQSFIEKALN